MKKLIIATFMMSFVFVATAQQTQTNKKSTNKTQQGKNTTGNRKTTDPTNNSGTGTENTGTSSGTTGTGSTGTSGTTGGTAENTGTGTTGTTGGTTGTGEAGTSGVTGTTGNAGTTGGTGTTGTSGTGATTGTTGSTGTSGQSGMNHGGDNMSGTMTSTGRYQAMGVTTGSLHRKDAKFVVMAASSNNLELQLSQVAQQKASSQAVKDFAAMMVQHHTMAGQEMKTMLSSKGALVPDTALMPMHRLQMETVMAAQGAAFDKAYMRIMVDAHEEDVDEFEDEVTDARDADIRAFAGKMLPILQTHYTKAKEVRKQVK